MSTGLEQAPTGSEAAAAKPKRSYWRLVLLVLTCIGAIVVYAIVSMNGHTEDWQLVQDAGRNQLPAQVGSSVRDISCDRYPRDLPYHTVRLRCAVTLDDGRHLVATALAKSRISHTFAAGGTRAVYATFIVQH